MSEPDELTPAERELAAALRSLKPAPAEIDPLRAAFDAGCRTARRQVQRWRLAAAAALLVGAGGWLVPHAAVERREHGQSVVVVHSPSPPPDRTWAAQSVARLQAAVRENGVAGLPTTHLPAVESRRRGLL